MDPFTFDKEKHSPYSSFRKTLILILGVIQLRVASYFRKFKKKKKPTTTFPSLYCTYQANLFNKTFVTKKRRNNFTYNMLFATVQLQHRKNFCSCFPCLAYKILYFTKFNISSKLLIFQINSPIRNSRAHTANLITVIINY